jgi:hypothetical protein
MGAMTVGIAGGEIFILKKAIQPRITVRTKAIYKPVGANQLVVAIIL